MTSKSLRVDSKFSANTIASTLRKKMIVSPLNIEAGQEVEHTCRFRYRGKQGINEGWPGRSARRLGKLKAGKALERDLA